MPRSSIKTDGTLDPITLAYAGNEVVELLLWNHTGSTIVVSLDNSNFACVKNDDAGNSEDVSSSFTIGADDCVHLVTINNTPASAAANLVFSFKGSHGTVSAGTRHQPDSLNFNGVFIAEL